MPTLFVAPATWLIGIATVSESNARDKWRGVGRVGHQRLVVCRALAPAWRTWGPIGDWFRAGRPVRAEFTRLGGHRMDRSNLPRALKAIEDAVALMLGIDDGDPLWRAEFNQEDNPRIGVRLRLERMQGRV